MPKQKKHHFFSISCSISSMVLIFLLKSCGTTRHLKDQEYLLRSNQIKLSTKQTFADKGALKDALKTVVVQQSNTYFLGVFPLKAWMYNVRHKTYEKDTANFQIRSGLAEKPVVFNRNAVSATAKQMEHFLFNQGYFNAAVKPQIDTNGKKVTVVYQIDTKDEFLIDTLHYEVDSSVLTNLMTPIWKEKSVIKPAMPYSSALISAERSQMVNWAKENGFYRFNTDNIQFELDTLAQAKTKSRRSVIESAANILAGQLKNARPTVSVSAFVKEQENYNSFEQFHYRNVYVYPDYQENLGINKAYNFIYEKNGLTFRLNDGDTKIRPSVLLSKIALKANSLFKQSDYNKTLLQLNELSVFNYARIYITENNDTAQDGKNYLDAHVILNQGKKYDFNTNFELSGGDLYLAGSAVNASITNKNLFRSASQLSLTGNYGFELNQTKNPDQSFFKRFYLMTQNIGLNARLVIPNLVSPIKLNSVKANAPKTVFNLGINFLDRNEYFRIRTFNSSYGYVWKSGPWSTWHFNPLFFNQLQLTYISDSFQRRLDEVQAIRNSYQENFILGENVEFIHNTDGKIPQRHHFIRIGLEESGILMKGISALYRGTTNKGLGFNYANYVRLDFDLRQYFKRTNRSFIMRMHGGIGLPYAHSKAMPYIKQYFVGGAYSIRGWGPRLLGPGSYYNPALSNANDRLFIDQSGDIKLEWNLEYRFKMIQLFAGAIALHGAVFTDAGNIWLSKKDEQLPGAHFQLSKLYKDIAVSSGAGLRADIGGFLILRADWALALKKPYIASNDGWVLNQFDFGSKRWRAENINLNIGIGMPF